MNRANEDSTHRLPVEVHVAAREDGSGRGSHEIRSGETVVNVAEPSSHREFHGGCHKGYKEPSTGLATRTSGQRSTQGRRMHSLYLAVNSIHGVLRGGTLENMGCGIPAKYRRDSTKRVREAAR